MSEGNEWFLAFVGIVFVVMFLLTFLKEFFRGIQLYFIPKFFSRDLKQYGDWAVVTGGSSGIGKCTAYELAKSGLNLVLVSNELEQLKSTVEDISGKFDVRCCYVHVDFTEGWAVYDYLWSQIEDKDIGIFINCAGIDGRSPIHFLDESERNILTMITLHVDTIINTTYRMTNHYSRKKNGVVVNVSSLASSFPSPYFATYSASKKFVDVFTKAVNIELEGKDVILQSLVPFFVNTPMGNNKPYLEKLWILFPLCQTFCESWIKCIGINKNFTGYWIHEVVAYCFRYCPRFVWNLGLKIMFDESEKLKK
ncbi:inactive hydroxysteroid dehydrogenase-like protein 1 [Centruroides vittatus]|uniref:inactive hydroxysteroid dehydrogenase-like protein 1 n=1 Tax=Centruroides vittatus TaxID=120091 RepID=UPI0035107915